MKFKIATPERIMLEVEANSISLPTALGEITVLPHHIPLISQLVAGEIKYLLDGKENFFAVSGGIIEVKKNGEVVVLADTAEFGHEIDVERAEAARETARKLMTEKRSDQKSYADATAVFERNLARLKVAHKHRTKKHQHLEN